MEEAITQADIVETFRRVDDALSRIWRKEDQAEVVVRREGDHITVKVLHPSSGIRQGPRSVATTG